MNPAGMKIGIRNLWCLLVWSFLLAFATHKFRTIQSAAFLTEPSLAEDTAAQKKTTGQVIYEGDFFLILIC